MHSKIFSTRWPAHLTIAAMLMLGTATFASRAADTNLDASAAPLFVGDVTLTETTRIGAYNDGYGSIEGLSGLAVAMDGDFALVGVPDSDDLGFTDNGAVLVYQRDPGTNTWSLIDQLLPDDPQTNGRFGSALDLEGSRALVGAWGRSGRAGGAYVFEFDGASWQQTSRLEVALGLTDLGWSVSLDGDRALLGAPLASAAFAFDLKDGVWSAPIPMPASDGAAGNGFGWDVSLSGDRAVVGAWSDGDQVGQGGAVYVFDLVEGVWQETDKLYGSNPYLNRRFGISVAVDGNRMAVGSGADDTVLGEGAVYVFDLSEGTWTETERLLSGSPFKTGQFGSKVQVAGDRIVAAASNANNGQVYVFEFDGADWQQAPVLVGSDAGAFDRLGTGISLSGDRVLAGAPGHGHDGYMMGTARMFELESGAWSETTELRPGNGAAEDEFGTAVSAWGDRILVGAPLDDTQPTSGAFMAGLKVGGATIYVFDGMNWTAEAHLKTGSPISNQRLGYAVSLRGNRALVGAYGDGNFPGAAHVFERDGMNWNHIITLVASDSAPNDQFGFAVAQDDGQILVGARDSAYLFELDQGIWTETLKWDNPQTGGGFGGPVQIGGDHALVAAPLANGTAFSAGAIYAFHKTATGWSAPVAIQATAGDSSDLFGGGLSLDGNRVLIGAWGEDEGNYLNMGAAYIFEYDGISWVQKKRLSPPGGGSRAEFGRAVALAGDRALVGTPFHSMGHLFHFDGTDWRYERRLVASDGAPPGQTADRLGDTNAVALTPDRAVAGARLDDNEGTNSGSVYVFEALPLDLSLSLAGPETALPGQPVEYTAQIELLAGASARALIEIDIDDRFTGVTWQLEDGVSGTSGTGNVSVTWPLVPGRAVDITIQALAPGPGNPLPLQVHGMVGDAQGGETAPEDNEDQVMTILTLPNDLFHDGFES